MLGIDVNRTNGLKEKVFQSCDDSTSVLNRELIERISVLGRKLPGSHTGSMYLVFSMF